MIPVPLETYGYTLTAEFSSDPYFPFFTTKSVTGDGRYVNLALTAEEVDTLQSSHFRIRATKGDNSKFVSLGRLNYIQEPLGPITGPQGPAGVAGATGPAGPKGDAGEPATLPDNIVTYDERGNVLVNVNIDDDVDPGNAAASLGYVQAKVAYVTDAFNESTEEPSPGTLVWRDDAGNAAFASPLAPDDAATKGYVDSAGTWEPNDGTLVRRNPVGGWVALSSLALTQQPTDPQAATRKDYVDNIGSVAASANTVARRDANGGFNVGWLDVNNVPNAPQHAARKDYVDGIGTTNSTANTVARRDGNGNVRFQEVFLDHVPTNTISAVRMDWVQNAIAAAGTANATASTVMRRDASGNTSVNTVYLNAVQDGSAFAVTRKDYVDGLVVDLTTATNLATANTLVKRDDSGVINVGRVFVTGATPTANAELTRKDYVDAIGGSGAVANTIVRRDASGASRFSNAVSTLAPTLPEHTTRKDYVDGLTADLGTATTSNVINTLVKRDASGQAAFQRVFSHTAPTGVSEVTRKDYVDAADRETIIRAHLGNSLWSAGGAEPFPRPSNNVQNASDFGFLSCFTAPLDNTITKIGVAVNGVGSGLTMFRLALYSINPANDACTMVARTDNDPTLPTVVGIRSLPLSTVGGYPASYKFIPGQRYAFGMVHHGTTLPTLVSYFLFEGSQVRPYIGAQFYVGAGDLPVGPTTINGQWWNSPWIVGLA